MHQTIFPLLEWSDFGTAMRSERETVNHRQMCFIFSETDGLNYYILLLVALYSPLTLLDTSYISNEKIG